MNKIIFFAFLFLVFVVSFLPVKDTDFGWHYRCGKEFITQKKLCLKNEFSYFLPNYKAAYSSFFFDIPLAYIYDHLGFVGLSILYSLILVAVAFLFVNLISGVFWLRIFCFWLMYFLSQAVFGLGLRDQIVSYLLFLVVLIILKKSKSETKKYLWLFPFLFFFWANTHLGFFIGLVVLIFNLFDELKKETFIFKLSILILSVLATFLNPFGLAIYKEILFHSLTPLGKMIAEWVPPLLSEKVLIVFLTIFLVLKSFKTKKFSFFYLLLLGFFFVLGLTARRNLVFFYTIFFYLTLDQNNNNSALNVDEIVASLLIVATVFFSIVLLPKTLDLDLSLENYCNLGMTRYPCLAIKNYPALSGNVFALYEWGGFLIWQKPKIKVYVDGRMPAWHDENGKSPYQVYLEIIQTQPGWNEKLNKLKTNYLLISRGTFLDELLKKESKKYHWRKVYSDENDIIYKNTAHN